MKKEHAEYPAEKLDAVYDTKQRICQAMLGTDPADDNLNSNLYKIKMPRNRKNVMSEIQIGSMNCKPKYAGNPSLVLFLTSVLLFVRQLHTACAGLKSYNTGVRP